MSTRTALERLITVLHPLTATELGTITQVAGFLPDRLGHELADLVRRHRTAAALGAVIATADLLVADEAAINARQRLGYLSDPAPLPGDVLVKLEDDAARYADDGPAHESGSV